MTYDSIEVSIEGGKPFELYEFTRGTWTGYLTTGASEFYVDAAKTFTPSPIKRTKIKQGQEALKDPVTLTLPRGDSLSSDFLNIPPEQSTSVTIRRCHTGLSYAESVVMWKGRVAGAKTSGESVNIVCDSIYTSIQQNGLRERMEYICQAPLYSVKCGVSQPSFRFDDTTVSVAGTIVTMTDLSSFADGYFKGGIVEFTGDRRFIIDHIGNILTLTRPLSVLSGSISVALYAGCNHMMDDCLDKFNNIVNFQGFPWIPSRNPFSGTIK